MRLAWLAHTAGWYAAHGETMHHCKSESTGLPGSARACAEQT